MSFNYAPLLRECEPAIGAPNEVPHCWLEHKALFPAADDREKVCVNKWLRH
jgi:hypothetical protein